MRLGRRLFAASALALPGLLKLRSASAQSAWPNRPIRLVVPYPPGGASDISGRLQAEVLQKALGSPVVVDNRSGAGGTVGTAHVAQSAPDGYTIFFGSVSTHAANPNLMREPGYDPLRDFAPLSMISLNPLGVLARPYCFARQAMKAWMISPISPLFRSVPRLSVFIPACRYATSKN